MTIDEALCTYLKTKTGITNLVNNKIYPLQIPQSTESPAITYSKISSDRPRSSVGGHSGLNNDVYQVSVFALTFSSLKDIVAQVHSALLNYRGLMGTVDVQGCFCVSEIDGFEEDTKEYFTYIDYQITY